MSGMEQTASTHAQYLVIELASTGQNKELDLATTDTQEASDLQRLYGTTLKTGTLVSSGS